MEVLLEQSDRLVYGKENPFMGEVVDRYRLTGDGSDKMVDHVVVDIGGSGMEYSCGDSLGVVAPNREEELRGVMDILGLGGEEEVEVKKVGRVLVYEALKWHLALDKPSKKFYDFCGVEGIEEGQGVLDVLKVSEEKNFDLQGVVDCMRRLQPRLYSAASSPMRAPGLVDLMVGVVNYDAHGRERWGVASGYLNNGVEVGDKVAVYVAKSHFKMPEDPGVDMIMVGPGTGVAPFRGFLQEQEAREGSGRSWLFFGDRTREHEYFYASDWEQFLENGTLARLDLAFSRDQDEKVYVQDRMLEEASEIWSWLEGGAYFYVCGDMKRMAKDVDRVLHEIVQVQGGMDEEGAKGYVKQLKKDKRYQRDVY